MAERAPRPQVDSDRCRHRRRPGKNRQGCTKHHIFQGSVARCHGLTGNADLREERSYTIHTLQDDYWILYVGRQLH